MPAALDIAIGCTAGLGLIALSVGAWPAAALLGAGAAVFIGVSLALSKG